MDFDQACRDYETVGILIVTPRRGLHPSLYGKNVHLFCQLDLHLLCEPWLPCTVPSLTGWLLMLLTPDKLPPSVSILTKVFVFFSFFVESFLFLGQTPSVRLNPEKVLYFPTIVFLISL